MFHMTILKDAVISTTSKDTKWLVRNRGYGVGLRVSLRLYRFYVASLFGGSLLVLSPALLSGLGLICNWLSLLWGQDPQPNTKTSSLSLIICCVVASFKCSDRVAAISHLKFHWSFMHKNTFALTRQLLYLLL